MFRAQRSLIALFCLTLAAGCMSDDISGSDQIGDVPEGRTALMSAIDPGRSTSSEVIALYRMPVAKNPQGGRTMQANVSSYSGASGYSAVQYTADTEVIYRVEIATVLMRRRRDRCWRRARAALARGAPPFQARLLWQAHP
ncbi:hypothetical protein [Epibacterium sp. Ofav1-8]|uniref:hypothetical protein n=1 Tax=Epibacterium sp. Ofav1-8 TaxID=2917735 RepID=UPI001EF42AB2|nr:hypothetical protein [Epibacterium sp. Ofav1-8]MCG7624795.1 hypothetical protein [Epibacterium sp. Ofav1-8]